MSENTPALLPTGLKDLLPPEAEEEARITTLLLAGFHNFGYNRVKPPLVEFEDSLLAAGPGQSLAQNTFRLMDPVSQKMMGVRADTTAQIARIAGSRLKDMPRPLRLSYAADVLRINASQLRTERQFCQVGCELIGASKSQNDVESCLIALKGLYDLGIENLSIDLTIPALIDTLLSSYKIDQQGQMEIENLLQKRDRDGLEALNNKISKPLTSLLDCSGLAEQAIADLKKAKLPKEAKATIKSLDEVYQGLKEALKVYGMNNVNITIDLIERRGFAYQSGISFTIFAPQVRGELGRGGRYRLSKNTEEQATGFTLYMDSVRQAVNMDDTQERRAVDAETSLDEIKKLQDQGIAVSRS